MKLVVLAVVTGSVYANIQCYSGTKYSDGCGPGTNTLTSIYCQPSSDACYSTTSSGSCSTHTGGCTTQANCESMTSEYTCCTTDNCNVDPWATTTTTQEFQGELGPSSSSTTTTAAAAEETTAATAAAVSNNTDTTAAPVQFSSATEAVAATFVVAVALVTYAI